MYKRILVPIDGSDTGARGLVEQANAQGVTAETSLHDLRGGRVADAIVEEARQSRCDLIVIGTHGRRGVARAMLGSDAENVVRSSPVPVLLVRAPAPVS